MQQHWWASKTLGWVKEARIKKIAHTTLFINISISNLWGKTSEQLLPGGQWWTGKGNNIYRMMEKFYMCNI